MFNLSSYYNTIKKYKTNKTNFEAIKKDIESEFNSFFTNIKSLDNTYFETIDKELERNKLYFFENLLVDKNIYADVITYTNYIEKIIANMEIDFDEFKTVSKSINFDLKMLDLLKEIITNIVNYYILDLKTGSTFHPVEIYFYDKLKNLKVDKLNLNINDYYTIEANTLFNNYSIKSEIDVNLNNIKTKLNNYIENINQASFIEKSKKYQTTLTKDQIGKINSILETMSYDSIPDFVPDEQPDMVIKQIGGEYNFETDNKLSAHSKYIMQVLNKQSELKAHIEEINKSINEYFVLLYDIYLYNVFFINEQQNRSYSLFVYNNLPYELIEKIYNGVRSIPNLNQDRYKIVFQIIDSYLLNNKIKKDNLSISGTNLKFVLLIDKLNILLRQYNDKKLNTTLSCKYNSHDIFILGNRPLMDELYIFFDISKLSFSNEDYIEFIGKLMFNFLVPNLYLINNIASDKFNIWKMQDLLLEYYITTTSLHKTVVYNGYKLTINNNKIYYFIDNNNFDKFYKESINYLIINFT